MALLLMKRKSIILTAWNHIFLFVKLQLVKSGFCPKFIFHHDLKDLIFTKITAANRHTERRLFYQHGYSQLADRSFPPVPLFMEEPTSQRFPPWTMGPPPDWEPASVQEEGPSQGPGSGTASYPIPH